MREDEQRPSMVVFEVATARRVGAQLRYNGGPRLAEIRVAWRILTGLPEPPARPTSSAG